MTRRADTASGDLFAIPQPAASLPASMDYRVLVSHLTSEVLKDAAAAGIDRYEVASRASRLSGCDMSKDMLDGYTAESREKFNLPFWWAPVIESVCSSTRLTSWLASVRGGDLRFGVATLDAEIGRLAHEQDQTAARIRQLKELRRRVR